MLQRSVLLNRPPSSLERVRLIHSCELAQNRGEIPKEIASYLTSPSFFTAFTISAGSGLRMAAQKSKHHLNSSRMIVFILNEDSRGLKGVGSTTSDLVEVSIKPLDQFRQVLLENGCVGHGVMESEKENVGFEPRSVTFLNGCATLVLVKRMEKGTTMAMEMWLQYLDSGKGSLEGNWKDAALHAGSSVCYRVTWSLYHC